MKKKVKIILSLIIGFAVAMALMAVSIYFGYSKAYDIESAGYTVKLFGISIYQLTKAGSEYTGAAIGPNMGIICGIFMALGFAIEEVVDKLRNKNQK